MREWLAVEIRRNALSWAVASADATEIDSINILQATLLAMRRAIAGLSVRPRHIKIDGNRCPSLEGLDLTCSIEAIVKGTTLFRPSGQRRSWRKSSAMP